MLIDVMTLNSSVEDVLTYFRSHVLTIDQNVLHHIGCWLLFIEDKRFKSRVAANDYYISVIQNIYSSMKLGVCHYLTFLSLARVTHFYLLDLITPSSSSNFIKRSTTKVESIYKSCDPSCSEFHTIHKSTFIYPEYLYFFIKRVLDHYAVTSDKNSVLEAVNKDVQDVSKCECCKVVSFDAIYCTIHSILNKKRSNVPNFLQDSPPASPQLDSTLVPISIEANLDSNDASTAQGPITRKMKKKLF